mgnify:CR=1 FL=1
MHPQDEFIQKVDAILNRSDKKHRHDGSIWIIAGGALLWCYQCGAFRQNVGGRVAGGWHKPSGIGGENPAMSKRK